MLPVPEVDRLAHSFPLLERCFDAPERARLGGAPAQRVAARLAAKAAALELLLGEVAWPQPGALDPPGSGTCELLSSVSIEGPEGPAAPTGPPQLVVAESLRARAPTRGRLLVSLSHDAELAAALVVRGGSGLAEQFGDARPDRG